MAGRLVGFGFCFFPHVFRMVNCAECMLYRLVGWIGTVHDLLGKKKPSLTIFISLQKISAQKHKFIYPKTSISYTSYCVQRSDLHGFRTLF
jgi:hypothetical protein